MQAVARSEAQSRPDDGKLSLLSRNRISLLLLTRRHMLSLSPENVSLRAHAGAVFSNSCATRHTDCSCLVKLSLKFGISFATLAVDTSPDCLFTSAVVRVCKAVVPACIAPPEYQAGDQYRDQESEHKVSTPPHLARARSHRARCPATWPGRHYLEQREARAPPRSLAGPAVYSRYHREASAKASRASNPVLNLPHHPALFATFMVVRFDPVSHPGLGLNEAPRARYAFGAVSAIAFHYHPARFLKTSEISPRAAFSASLTVTPPNPKNPPSLAASAAF